jgi:hypothetical protein
MLKIEFTKNPQGEIEGEVNITSNELTPKLSANICLKIIKGLIPPAGIEQDMFLLYFLPGIRHYLTGSTNRLSEAMKKRDKEKEINEALKKIYGTHD